jgi:hypothetical protein
MRIVFKPYLRRDGTLMLFINNDRGVSVGVSPEKGYGLSKDLTQGKRNLINAALAAFKKHAVAFTGDLANHTEGGLCAPVNCDGYNLVGTDVANIGGHETGSDGGFIVRGGLILQTGVWIDDGE